MADPEGYRVQLPVFQGPLDLLLELIEQRELEITKVSLAEVANQFLDYIVTLDHLDPRLLADFLVVAAKLLWIKSQALLPQPPPVESEEEEDVGDALVRQLREYKRFKEVALALRQREETGLRSYIRVAPFPQLERRLEPGEVSLSDLAQALQRILAQRREEPAPLVLIQEVVISLDDKIAEVERRVFQEGQVVFDALFSLSASRLEVIITFLALLELIKRGRVQAKQERLFGEIVISPCPCMETGSGS